MKVTHFFNNIMLLSLRHSMSSPSSCIVQIRSVNRSSRDSYRIQHALYLSSSEPTRDFKNRATGEFARLRFQRTNLRCWMQVLRDLNASSTRYLDRKARRKTWILLLEIRAFACVSHTSSDKLVEVISEAFSTSGLLQLRTNSFVNWGLPRCCNCSALRVALFSFLCPGTSCASLEALRAMDIHRGDSVREFFRARIQLRSSLV